jgi:hypothetical protein
MSESQRRSHRGEIAFFKAPVVFGLGKSIGITGERLHNSFFKDVLSPRLDSDVPRRIMNAEISLALNTSSH